MCGGARQPFSKGDVSRDGASVRGSGAVAPPGGRDADPGCQRIAHRTAGRRQHRRRRCEHAHWAAQLHLLQHTPHSDWVKELKDQSSVTAVKVKTEKNLADLYTKCHTAPVRRRLQKELEEVAAKIAAGH